MSAAHDLDEAAHARRVEEHAFVANAIVAGCSVQGRPFTAREASDAASAVCNLALENGAVAAGREALSPDFLVRHSLIPIFQAGWSVLYREVSLYAADELLRGLNGLRTIDRDVETGLAALRYELARQRRAGTPWRARPALDVLLILDATIWAALDALLDECPVMHEAIGASREGTAHGISPLAFEFISENQQISAVREFMQSLAGRLRA